MAKAVCCLCRQPTKEGFTGKIVTGWVADYSEKSVTEGFPVILIVCQKCIDDKKIALPMWSSVDFPIRVTQAQDHLTIELHERSTRVLAPDQVAGNEADRKAQEPQQQTAAAQPSQTAKREEPRSTPPPPPPSPPIGAQKGGMTKIPALVCSQCGKSIDQEQHNVSTYIFHDPLCTVCYLPRAKSIIEMMKVNEAAGKPITEGIGHTKAVGFCACGAIVSDQMKKASAMMFGKSMCRRCFDAARAAHAQHAKVG